MEWGPFSCPIFTWFFLILFHVYVSWFFPTEDSIIKSSSPGYCTCWPNYLTVWTINYNPPKIVSKFRLQASALLWFIFQPWILKTVRNWTFYPFWHVSNRFFSPISRFFANSSTYMVHVLSLSPYIVPFLYLYCQYNTCTHYFTNTIHYVTRKPA
jgi:hypothetical protein